MTGDPQWTVCIELVSHASFSGRAFIRWFRGFLLTPELCNRGGKVFACHPHRWRGAGTVGVRGHTCDADTQAFPGAEGRTPSLGQAEHSTHRNPAMFAGSRHQREGRRVGTVLTQRAASPWHPPAGSARSLPAHPRVPGAGQCHCESPWGHSDAHRETSRIRLDSKTRRQVSRIPVPGLGGSGL